MRNKVYFRFQNQSTFSYVSILEKQKLIDEITSAMYHKQPLVVTDSFNSNKTTVINTNRIIYFEIEEITNV